MHREGGRGRWARASRCGWTGRKRWRRSTRARWRPARPIPARPASSKTRRQTRFSRDALAATRPADPAGEAWTRGVRVTENTPLAEVARGLQRYRGGHIGVAPEVARLPVIGSYPATDPDRALAMLESVLPVRIKHTQPWHGLLHHARHGRGHRVETLTARNAAVGEHRDATAHGRPGISGSGQRAAEHHGRGRPAARQ